MKIYYKHTEAKNGGFGVLGNGIRKALLQKGHKLVEHNPDVVLVYGVPQILMDARKKFPDKKIVYYTVWESSRYPEKWIKMIEISKPDLVLTATKYTQWVLSRDDIKAEVWHHGIDDRWKYKKRKDDGILTFIHYNAFEWRKGWDIALLAFRRQFGDREDVRLILKGRERDARVWIADPKTDKLGFNNVEEILGHVNDQEMVDMIYRADCGVFPVHGEGWMLPSMECAASGIPVIMSKQMSMTEQWVRGYIDLKIDGWINARPRYSGAMIQPSIRHLQELYKWCDEHQNELGEMGKVASKDIHEKFNWSKITDQLIVHLNKLNIK